MSQPSRTLQGKTWRRILTNDEVKALPTTPIAIIPAPGDGFMILPVAAFLQMDWTANYTNINASANIQLGPTTLDTNILAVVSQATYSGVSGLLAAGGDRAVWVGIEGQYNGSAAGAQITDACYVIDPDDFNNEPLNLAIDNNGGGVLTGGNAANRLIVTAYYNIVSLL